MTGSTTVASGTTVGEPETAVSLDDTSSADRGWVEEPGIDGAWGAFYSVWGPTPDDLWIAGGRVFDDGTSEGVLVHGDGSTWAREKLDPSTPVLSWIGPAGDDVWVVGADGTCLRREGGDWVRHETDDPRRLWGVWGAAEDDVWAVGGNGIDDVPALLHFDGAQWSEQALPELDGNALFKVWGRRGDDVWVVGDGGIVLHYDGDAWTSIANESVADLIGVHGSGEVLLTVGGRANGRVAQLTAAGAEGETLVVPGLAGVWVDSAGRATVAGDLGTLGTLEPGASTIELYETNTILLFHAVHGFDGGPRWAVGGDLVDAAPSFGIVLRHDSP
ncbi:MAG: hypothetical protein AAF799_25805 [Myxococcota bacterium]